MQRSSLLRRALAALLLLAVSAAATGINDNYQPSARWPPQTAPPVPNCTVYWYNQRLDHFNRFDLRRWPQRYFVCTPYWKRGPREPVFMYLGNEAPVSAWPTIFSDMAREEGGLLLYAEHRYYGESLPLGNTSLTNAGLQWLTTEQVLADYAELVQAVRVQFGVPPTAGTVCYGGSYGGNLAAYLRLKYPKVFHASLASSAVIKYLMPAAPYFETRRGPFKIMTHALRDAASNECASRVELAFQTLQSQLAYSPEGRAQLAQALHMCNPANLTSATSVDAVAYNLRDLWWGLFQTIYRASPTTNGAADACKVVLSYPASPLGAVAGMAAAISGEPCVPDSFAILPFSQQDPRPDDPSMLSWMYQCCRQGWVVSTHMVSAPPSIYGLWNLPLSFFSQWCTRTYGLRHPMQPPREFLYTPSLFARTSKLILSNGEYDPWMAGSILYSKWPGVKTIITPKASHRQDLSAAQPGNTAAFNATQTQIKAWIRQWVVEGPPHWRY